jgi:type VI secretion system secreted protein VgrG
MTAILENRKLRMTGPLPRTKMFLKAARVTEGLSKLSEITLDFMSTDKALNLADLVGQSHTVMVKLGSDDDSTATEGSDDDSSWRKFMGTCIEAQLIGLHEGYGFYSVELRPWLWFLTRTTGCRIFQNLNAVDIIKKIFGDRGFADYSFDLSRTPDPRVYCVQYNETDYDFVCRLMEEEGIYFYSTVERGKDHLMLVDDIGKHKPVPGAASIDFALREAEYRRTADHIFEWRGSENVTSGKVSLRDYNFEKPKADLTASKAIPKGSHPHKNYELYGYPGRHRETPLGDIHARVRMESEACRHLTRSGIGNVRTLATGHTFALKDHGRSSENQDYLITGAVHLMQIEVQNEDESQQLTRESRAKGQTGATGGTAPKLPGTIEIDEDNKDSYRCTFETIPKNVPFRAPLTTPWPQIPGILLAKVTGPAGEEIYTDKYGRIKVQFPWDREGKNDENTTCWIRYVTPWSGKNWGMIHIPRIGQEVVIQFEDGDPDRPICTGMLYNADLMPPYALPDNMTQSGIVTRSTKGGSTNTFNELIFEDKKDAEFVRLQSEKDYKETIKNNAVITVGMEKKDPGDYTMTIYNNRTETVKTGDSTFTVETGNEIRDIKTNKTETIGKDSTKEVKGNLSSTVKGNEKHEIKGNRDASITGNAKNAITGTYTNDVTGSVTIESKQSITLKVGGNSITIDQSGITIKGIMVETNATGMATHKASGIMTIQGSLVNIN